MTEKSSQLIEQCPSCLQSSNAFHKLIIETYLSELSSPSHTRRPSSHPFPKVTAAADYNVTLRYASASTGKANLFLNAYSCDVAESKDALLGSAVMPDSGGEAGPFSRTAPFTVRCCLGDVNGAFPQRSSCTRCFIYPVSTTSLPAAPHVRTYVHPQSPPCALTLSIVP